MVTRIGEIVALFRLSLGLQSYLHSPSLIGTLVRERDREKEKPKEREGLDDRTPCLRDRYSVVWSFGVGAGFGVQGRGEG